MVYLISVCCILHGWRWSDSAWSSGTLPQVGDSGATCGCTAIESLFPSLRLNALQKQMSQEALESSTVTDQLMVAADLKPRRFWTKWQQACNEGPTARRDAESAERVRWFSLLTDLLRDADTPMGRLLRESLAASQLLGGGRRAGALRSRVQAIQKFLGWLAAAHNVAFPVHWKHLVEYLQVRLSEPCVRRSLKLVHASFVFLQEIAGVQDKLTDAALYCVSRKELLASALPGKPPRKARYRTILLAAFEESVMSWKTPLIGE